MIMWSTTPRMSFIIGQGALLAQKMLLSPFLQLPQPSVHQVSLWHPVGGAHKSGKITKTTKLGDKGRGQGLFCFLAVLQTMQDLVP